MNKKKNVSEKKEEPEQDIIKTITSEVLKVLEIEGDFELTTGEEGLDIVLNTKDTGIVIGYHGETLEALQLVLALILAKQAGEFKRVSLEAGDYKKNREEWLKNAALDAKDRAINQGREISLPELKAWERRIVHLALKDDKEVISESVGEGRERVLIIRPK